MLEDRGHSSRFSCLSGIDAYAPTCFPAACLGCYVVRTPRQPVDRRVVHRALQAASDHVGRRWRVLGLSQKKRCADMLLRYNSGAKPGLKVAEKARRANSFGGTRWRTTAAEETRTFGPEVA